LFTDISKGRLSIRDKPLKGKISSLYQLI